MRKRSSSSDMNLATMFWGMWSKTSWRGRRRSWSRSICYFADCTGRSIGGATIGRSWGRKTGRRLPCFCCFCRSCCFFPRRPSTGSAAWKNTPRMSTPSKSSMASFRIHRRLPRTPFRHSENWTCRTRIRRRLLLFGYTRIRQLPIAWCLPTPMIRGRKGKSPSTSNKPSAREGVAQDLARWAEAWRRAQAQPGVRALGNRFGRGTGHGGKQPLKAALSGNEFDFPIAVAGDKFVVPFGDAQDVVDRLDPFARYPFPVEESFEGHAQRGSKPLGLA